MHGLALNLLPLIVGAAVLPLWVILSLLLVRSDNGVAKATSFVAGAMSVRIVQGILFGYVFGCASEATGGRNDQVIASTLLVVAGIVMLIAALKTWMKDEDIDAPPPKWMAAISRVSAPIAFGIGVLMMAVAVKQWVFTLAAIAVIEEAHMSHKANVLVYLAFVIGAKLLVLAPVIASMAMPGRAGRLLDAMQRWLERNNRTIAVAASLIFGSWFLWKGVTGLFD